MSTILWVFGGITANMVVGAIVWAEIDTDDKRLFRWYDECPKEISWFAQPFVLMAWPIFLWFWWNRGRPNGHNRDKMER